MQMRTKLEALIDQMLDGGIRLDEAVAEFEKLYILKALQRYEEHLSNTAKALGIHRNTLSKRVTSYRKNDRPAVRAAKQAGG